MPYALPHRSHLLTVLLAIYASACNRRAVVRPRTATRIRGCRAIQHGAIGCNDS